MTAGSKPFNNHSKTFRSNIIIFCVVISFFSSSFDNFGVINIAGYNFRLCQLALLPLIILFFFKYVLFRKHIVIPKHCIFLVLFFLLNTIFIFRSPDLKNAFFYDLWLLFNILVILSFYYLIPRILCLHILMQFYVNSFVFVSVIGIIQLILYYFGVDFYITQAWSDVLCRVSGFSYEPSFYASYLLMGEIITSYLYIKNDETIISKKYNLSCFIIISIGLILSSSRMGTLSVFLYFLYLFFVGIKNRSSYYVRLLMLMFIYSIFFLIYYRLYSLNVISRSLVEGLDLFDATNNWSSKTRLDGLVLALKFFLDNPLLGYSFWGVDPVFAEYYSVPYSSINNGLSTSIIGDCLMAGGVFGVIFLLTFFTQIFNLGIKSKNTLTNAMALSLLFELIILCFNQNILRPYLWVHIAFFLTLLDYNFVAPKKKN